LGRVRPVKMRGSDAYVYVGTAYSNRYEYVMPKKPRLRTRRSGERSCRRPRPPEQWIAIPVPVLIDQQTWDRAKAQLARNAAMSFRHNKKNDYLLRCLLKCGTCGLGIHGACSAATNGRSGHRYYKCAGTDALTTGRDARCPRARIDAGALEQAVWDHITGLLGDPSQLSAQFERFVAEADAAQTREETPSQQLRARLDRLDRADRRLLEAYQAEVISLAELAERRQGLAEQRRLASSSLSSTAAYASSRFTPKTCWTAWLRSANASAHGCKAPASPTARRSCSW